VIPKFYFFFSFLLFAASTPVIAALIAQFNFARIATGGEPVGFLNPLLYGLPSSVFNGKKKDEDIFRSE
jgi:hypothetical protein